MNLHIAQGVQLNDGVVQASVLPIAISPQKLLSAILLAHRRCYGAARCRDLVAEIEVQKRCL